MTQPYPPVPPGPPFPADPRPSSGVGDILAAWLLWGLLVVVEGVVVLVMMFAGWVTAASCANDDTYGSVCSGSHGDTLWISGLALCGLMLVATVAALVMMIVRTMQARKVWPWPLAALGVVVLATCGWFGYLVAVS